MIDTVLFDLDGTLLPMDQDAFINTYMELLGNYLAPYGYNPRTLVAAVWSGTSAMVQNDGTRTNESAFWQDFCEVLGPGVRRDEPLFEEFYATAFSGARTVCGVSTAMVELVQELKARGLTLILATNPIFPAVATRQRIRWAGLNPGDFAHITTYENSRFCKPNPNYYRELLAAVGKSPENCLMVGNDVGEDMIPAQCLGMETFLLTDCLINKTRRDVTEFHHGGPGELKDFLLKGR